MEGFPCTPNPSCPYYYRPEGCFEDTHHEYYGADYNTICEKVFRNLPRNLTEMCRRLHEVVHEVEEPPLKPSHDYMVQEIRDAEAGGEVTLSNNRRRKVYGNPKPLHRR